MESMAIAIEPRLRLFRKTLIPRLLLGVATIMLVVGLKWFAQPPQDNDDDGCKRPEITGVARSPTSNDMYDPCVINTTLGASIASSSRAVPPRAIFARNLSSKKTPREGGA